MYCLNRPQTTTKRKNLCEKQINKMKNTKLPFYHGTLNDIREVTCRTTWGKWNVYLDCASALKRVK